MLAAPLRFTPLFRRYLWGGRRLGTHLGKAIGPESDYAESWEIVDHGADQSVVADGPWRGKTLRELVETQNKALFGRFSPASQFPLLFKFLDCCQDLSLQVHPNDEQAKLVHPAERGKTEAWVFLDAQPGSVAYAGLKSNVDQQAVEQHIAAGTLSDCLHQLRPQQGDCLFIPAGSVHALGAGFLVAEIQQSSDTTYRLFDWNRVGADGKSRPLHIAEGLSVTDFAAGPINPQKPIKTERPFVEQLVQCEKFVLDRWNLSEPQRLPADDRFHLLAVLHGAVAVEREPLNAPLRTGQTMLVPAACADSLLTPLEPTTLLDIYLPDGCVI